RGDAGPSFYQTLDGLYDLLRRIALRVQAGAMTKAAAEPQGRPRQPPPARGSGRLIDARGT
ncbi:hypothetical protein ACIRP3_44130, partial [Streptomyces sp. NPDC101209]|uniref:hypothetical protein n=1 Tax=Streptomyces sp. NPDC101209 TaxID=3366129 RepID=UPI0038042C59